MGSNGTDATTGKGQEGAKPASGAAQGESQDQAVNKPGTDGNNAANGGNPPPKSEGNDNGNKEDKPVKAYSPQQVNAILRRKREEWDLERQQAAQEAAQEATRKAQEGNGEFKPLYEQTKGELTSAKATIKSLTTDLDGLREELNAIVDDTIADWPDEVKAMDPAVLNPDGVSPKLRFAWMRQAAKLVAGLGNTTNGTGNGGNPPHNPPSPRPANAQSEQVDLEAYKARTRANNALNL